MNAPIDITGVTDNTKEVQPGMLFVCIRGGHFDGHSAAAEMLEKGAAAVVCGTGVFSCAAGAACGTGAFSCAAEAVYHRVSPCGNALPT